jgi:hypothetical protein
MHRCRSTKRPRSATMTNLKMATSRKVAAYCRVSTIEQKKKGLGMDVQIRDAYLQLHNITVCAWRSSTKMKRRAERLKIESN